MKFNVGDKVNVIKPPSYYDYLGLSRLVQVSGVMSYHSVQIKVKGRSGQIFFIWLSPGDVEKADGSGNGKDRSSGRARVDDG